MIASLYLDKRFVIRSLLTSFFCVLLLPLLFYHCIDGFGIFTIFYFNICHLEYFIFIQKKKWLHKRKLIIPGFVKAQSQRPLIVDLWIIFALYTQPLKMTFYNTYLKKNIRTSHLFRIQVNHFMSKTLANFCMRQFDECIPQTFFQFMVSCWFCLFLPELNGIKI